MQVKNTLYGKHGSILQEKLLTAATITTDEREKKKEKNKYKPFGREKEWRLWVFYNLLHLNLLHMQSGDSLCHRL